MTVFVDFETRSRYDLKSKGVYNYAQDGSTDVLCMAYAYDDGEVQLWLPDMPLPDFGCHQIRAHNAAFERLIFWYVLQKNYAVEQFYCTAAQARANCLPGSLEDVGRAISSSMRKSFRGSQLIRLLSIPRGDGSFNNDPALLQEMYDYCLQDVRSMRAISLALRELSEEELDDYHINEHINDRGVLVDLDLCRAAVRYSDVETEEVQQIVFEVSGLTSVRSPKMRQWVQDRVGKQALELMTVYKDGEKKMSVDKSVRASLLILADKNPEEVPPEVAEVLQCADDMWASSVAKFNRLAQLADEEDHRVRGAFVFNGGSATGRSSSFGAQVHNFTRKCADDPEAVRHAMVRGHSIVPQFGKRVTDVLKGMLRPALVPAPGNVFVVADWAGIEARCNPWLSAHPQSEEVLDVFREGHDIYIREAAGIFGCAEADVDKSKRTIGKVASLACGFAGGAGAFASMGRVYGVLLPESDAVRTVNAWRRANQWAVMYWQDLEEAYLRAMRNVGHEFSAGRVTYRFDGQHLWYILPSGRVLCYPFARLEEDGVSYIKAAWKPAADATEWPRARLWKGLACIAKSTPVLTEKGWVPIEDVSTDVRVWDGECWVSHKGVSHQGYGEVNYTFGVATTRDHLLLTTKGWKRADEIQGYYRASCELPDRHENARLGWETRGVGDTLRLRSNQNNEATELYEAGEREQDGFLRVHEKAVAIGEVYYARHEQAPSVCCMAKYVRPLSATIASGMEKLRGAGDNSVQQMARFFRELLGGYAPQLSTGFVSGQNKQRGGVLPRKLSVGYSSSTSEEHTKSEANKNPARCYDNIGAIRENRYRGVHASLSNGEWSDWCRPNIEAGRITEIFDLIDCGPNRRFVVQSEDGAPVIVHNCENICQAVANDLLRHSLRRLDNVVLHVHDEIVKECPADKADVVMQQMKEVMCTPPDWAQGLPLEVDIKVMTRYGK